MKNTKKEMNNLMLKIMVQNFTYNVNFTLILSERSVSLNNFNFYSTIVSKANELSIFIQLYNTTIFNNILILDLSRCNIKLIILKHQKDIIHIVVLFITFSIKC
jgi:hypothetical protein